MIPVTFHQLLVILLVLGLGGVLTAWLWADWARRRRERHAFRSAIRCRLCACVFEDATPETQPHCPACGAKNERRAFSRI